MCGKRYFCNFEDKTYIIMHIGKTRIISSDHRFTGRGLGSAAAHRKRHLTVYERPWNAQILQLHLLYIDQSFFGQRHDSLIWPLKSLSFFWTTPIIWYTKVKVDPCDLRRRWGRKTRRKVWMGIVWRFSSRKKLKKCGSRGWWDLQKLAVWA